MFEKTAAEKKASYTHTVLQKIAMASRVKDFDPRKLKRPLFVHHLDTGRYSNAEVLDDFMRKGAPARESLGPLAQSLDLDVVQKAPMGKLIKHLYPNR